MGDGATALGSTALNVAVVEIDPSSGNTVQTIPLNPGTVQVVGGVITGGCAINGNFVVEGFGATSADGRYAAVPCYAVALGGSATAALNRTVVRLGPDAVPE